MMMHELTLTWRKVLRLRGRLTVIQESRNSQCSVVSDLYTPCPEKNGPPKHVKITLCIQNDSHYFSLCDEKPSICNVYVKFHDN